MRRSYGSEIWFFLTFLGLLFLEVPNHASSVGVSILRWRRMRDMLVMSSEISGGPWIPSSRPSRPSCHFGGTLILEVKSEVDVPER